MNEGIIEEDLAKNATEEEFKSLNISLKDLILTPKRNANPQLYLLI